MIGKTITDIGPGDHAELVRPVEQDHIAGFIDAVGDLNPVHSDADYAATTPFKAPIAPGIFTAGLISAVIGTQLPGPGAVYLSQSLEFVKPVRAGDIITARVDVLEILREKNRVRLQTVCVNQCGEEVLSGGGVGDAVEGARRLCRASAACRSRGGPRAQALGAGGPGREALGRARHISSPPLIESSAPVM
jgi:3-hydroxybutyryl-CoA dehydratase